MRTLNPITLVMVDDNIDEIFLTRRQVRQQGIVNNFVSERKPENLIETLAEIQSDINNENILILLDMNMPKMDGLATLRRIRSEERFKDLLVVMLSASDNEADISAAESLGASGWMVKPFSMEALIGVIGDNSKVKYRLMQ